MIRLAIADVFQYFSNPLRFGKEEERDYKQKMNRLLRQRYRHLAFGKGESSNILTTVTPTSMTSLSENTILNPNNKESKFKSALTWRKDVDTSHNIRESDVAFTSYSIAWSVSNNKWCYNLVGGEKWWGGVVHTQLERNLARGEYVLTGEDNQSVQCLESLILHFSNEGEVVWDVLGNISQLKEVCERLNRVYLAGELDESVYPKVPYELGVDEYQPKVIENESVGVMSAKLNEITLGDVYDFLGTVKDESVDFLVTDPPYNVSVKRTSVFKGRELVVSFGEWDYDFDLEKWVNQVATKVKTGGFVCIFNAFKNIELLGTILEEHGFRVLPLGVWEKPNPLPTIAKVRPCNSVESFILAYKGEWVLPTPINPSVPIAFLNSGESVIEPHYVRSVFEGQQERFHTTQKPESLFKDLILTFSSEGDLVMDTFSGSGVTATVCQNTSRNYLAVELDESYHKQSTVRVRNQSSRKRSLNR